METQIKEIASRHALVLDCAQGSAALARHFEDAIREGLHAQAALDKTLDDDKLYIPVMIHLEQMAAKESENEDLRRQLLLLQRGQ